MARWKELFSFVVPKSMQMTKVSPGALFLHFSSEIGVSVFWERKKGLGQGQFTGYKTLKCHKHVEPLHKRWFLMCIIASLEVGTIYIVSEFTVTNS